MSFDSNPSFEPDEQEATEETEEPRTTKKDILTADDGDDTDGFRRRFGH